MRSFSIRLSFTLCLFIIGVLTVRTSFAQIPEHFYNDPQNINSDPDYTPGDYPLSDINDAKTYYQMKKEELASSIDATASDLAFTVGLGEITYTSIKNESNEVLGYFRNYFGKAKVNGGAVKSITLVVDINSMDTAVPGRNNRILELFFQSMKPQLGTAIINFDNIDAQGNASGTIWLNEVKRDIQAQLKIVKKNDTWVVESQQPLNLLISDFDFGNRVFDLIKECNHKALGNNVKIKVELYFK